MSPRPDVSVERKNQILEAALTVFARSGFHKTRMDDIVEESGLSKGSLYWYFKSKEEIFSILIERFIYRETRDVENLLTSNGTALERLLATNDILARDLRKFSRIMPVAYEFYAAALRQKKIRKILGAYFARFRTVLGEMIQQGIDSGEFTTAHGDADEIAFTIIAVYEGLMLLMMISEQNDNWEAMTRKSLGIILDGIRAKANTDD
jgi:AcrR family transcriptional regulator